MKRILSTLLVAAMLLSLVIVAAVPASAADGDWTTYATASEYADGAEKSPIPGYKYEGGAKMIPADFTNKIPFGTIQTKNKVNLKDGLYMEVRIDEFSWDASDEWININLWSQPMIEPGSSNPMYGHGVQTLLRNTYTPATDDAPESAVLKINNQDRIYYINEFERVNYTDAEKTEKKEAVVDLLGGETIKFDVRYNNGAYTVSINGIPAPQKVNDYIAETFKDGMVYVGVTLRNSTTGGKAACTITKFGTSADKATTPSGDDSAAPINNTSSVAPIADPSTVEAGKPAVFLTGDLANSDLKSTPNTLKGTIFSINDDYTIRMSAAISSIDCGLSVKNDVSYDIKDFPYVMVLMKNFCTCDDPTECYAVETVNMYLMCGDVLSANDKVRILEFDVCREPLVVKEDTTVNGVEIEAGNYLYFFTNCLDASFNPEGRINAVNVGMSGLKVAEEGRNYADMVFTGFFRTEKEGIAYVYDYLGLEAEGGEDTDEETTVESDEETTEAVEDTTAAVDTDEETTEKKADATTAAKDDDDKKEDDKDDDKDEDVNIGCSAVVGTGVVAIVAVVTACGFVSFKKKED